MISGAPPYGGSYTISNNFIGGLDENANGLFTTTGTMNPLSILTSDTMPSQFSNNKIRGVQFPVGNFEAIRIYGNFTLDGNTISDFTISVNGTSLTTYSYTFMLGNDSAKFINNNVSNILLKNLNTSSFAAETLTVSKYFKRQVGNTFSNFTTYHPSNSFNTLIMSNKEVSSNTFLNITNSVCISGQISTATVAKNNYFKNLINSTGIQTGSSVIGNEFLNCTGTFILSCTSVISNTINNLTKGTMISKCDEIHRNFIATDNVQGGTVLYGISSNKKI